MTYYWNLNPMRLGLKDRILAGIAVAGTHPADVLNNIIEMMTKTDRAVAERFLMWACQNEVTLKAETIEVRYHEYKKKLSPISDEEAAEIWRAFDPDTPPEALWEFVLHRNSDFRGYVSANPSASVDILNFLSVDKDEEVRRRVAMHYSTTAEIFERLAKDKESSVRDAVLKNYTSGPKALAELAGDTNWYIRRDVAEHPSTDAQTLARLANDREEYVREKVARHPSTPAAALAQLAGDREPNIRACVARHPATPFDVLDLLAKDPHEYVREAVAENPGPPPPVQRTFRDLLSEYEAAKQALLNYLNEKYPSGEPIKTRSIEGTILSTSISNGDDPVLSIESPGGRLIEVNPLELDSDPPEKPKRARDRVFNKK